jgi:hypothetical protein
MDGRQTWSGRRQIEKLGQGLCCAEERQGGRQAAKERSGGGLNLLTGSTRQAGNVMCLYVQGDRFVC